MWRVVFNSTRNSNSSADKHVRSVCCSMMTDDTGPAFAAAADDEDVSCMSFVYLPGRSVRPPPCQILIECDGDDYDAIR